MYCRKLRMSLWGASCLLRRACRLSGEQLTARRALCLHWRLAPVQVSCWLSLELLFEHLSLGGSEMLEERRVGDIERLGDLSS